MTLKGKEPAIIIASAVLILLTLILVLFFYQNKYHVQRDEYTLMASESLLSSFMTGIETAYEQSSLLVDRIEWETIQVLKDPSPDYSQLERRFLDFQSVIPEGIGFMVYLLNEDIILSSFSESRNSREFFTSWFIIKDTDPYRWRNELISSSPDKRLDPAGQIVITGNELTVLPLYHIVYDPVRAVNSAALICVFMKTDSIFPRSPDFPLPQGAVLEIRDSMDNNIYSLVPDQAEGNVRYNTLSFKSPDKSRIYSLYIPEKLFAHRTTISAIFLLLQAVLFVILASGGLLSFYAFMRRRLRTIHGLFETFSKRGAAGRFMDQVLIENSGIANSFVIRNHLERNYFLQQCINSIPPGPEAFHALADQYDLNIGNGLFLPVRITLSDIPDSYRRRLRTLALQEFLEQIRSADDIFFDENPGTTGFIVSAGNSGELSQRLKKIIHKLKTKFRYINCFCGRAHPTLLNSLYFWFETSPGCFMKKTENRAFKFEKDDSNLLYYYPAAMEFVLHNSVINGNRNAVAYICELIYAENFSDRFTGNLDEQILYRELDQTILKIQINSDISGAPQADIKNISFAKYKDLFMQMADEAVSIIALPEEDDLIV